MDINQCRNCGNGQITCTYTCVHQQICGHQCSICTTVNLYTSLCDNCTSCVLCTVHHMYSCTIVQHVNTNKPVGDNTIYSMFTVYSSCVCTTIQLYNICTVYSSSCVQLYTCIQLYVTTLQYSTCVHLQIYVHMYNIGNCMCATYVHLYRQFTCCV